MNRQSGFLQIYFFYAMGGLLAALLLTGWLLKNSYQANGALKSDVAEAMSALDAKQKAFDDLQAEGRRVQVITVDNLAEKEIVEVKVEKIVYKIQEVIKNAPPTSCLVQPIDPVVLDCLRDLSCDEAGDPEGISP